MVSAAPICSNTTNGFHLLNVNGRKLVGDTVLELDNTFLSLEFTDVTRAMDFTEDSILTSPLNNTILIYSTPPLDPIIDCTASAPLAVVSPRTEDMTNTPPVDGDNIPCISQTHNTTSNDISPEIDCISNNESMTSQTDATILEDLSAHSAPHNEALHAILSHRYNDGCLEFKVEYADGDKTFIPFKLVQNDDPWLWPITF